MDYRQTLRFVAAGRIAIGVAMLAAPRRAAAGWLGPGTGAGAGSVLARAFGAREVAVGAGSLWALDRGDPVRPWVVAGVVCDGLDTVATVLGARHLGFRRFAAMGAVAATATAIGVAALDHVD